MTAELTAPEAPSTAAARPAGRWRRIVGWVVLVVLVLGGGVLGMRMAVSPPQLHGSLDPEARGPQGAGALAELLRQDGVEITVVRRHAELADALSHGATLALPDPALLSDETVTHMVAAADRVVFLSSSARTVELFGLGESATSSADRAAPECAVAAFGGIERIEPERMFTPAEGVTGCFTDDDGAAAVLVDESAQISLVEGARLFSNEHLAENHNAALGLALLGQSDEVVWYVPSLEDSDLSGDTPATLGDHTPSWVTPAIVLLLLAGLTAAFWRGRRFGPLVAETLPVTVRASETMQGRARLTAKAADAPHAASALRTGAVKRLARALGLDERTTAVEVADAASDRLGIARGTLYDLLGGALPADDHQLVEFARRLAELEDAVAATRHTTHLSEGNTP